MIGRVLGNRYEILEKVGSGGMANVYKARDRMLNRFVAVKVLHSEFKEDEEFIRRFNIESQAAASLSHQNIVQIYDVGNEDGIQYIVMEFLNGITLKEYIKSKEGGLYWKEAVDYSMQICRALEHAHSKHIIHRDIKPQNIVVTPERILKVTDFGIARAANNNTTKMNSTAIGSAHYISPEQARGGYTDQRSDIYSLGVVMYELLTGRLPFDAEAPVAVAMKHIQEAPVPPSKYNSAIPKGLEQVILRAMSKEVRLRYSSAEEVLNDLKLLYIDPEAHISDAKEESEQNGETRKIDSREIKRRTAESVQRSEEEIQSRKKKKKSGLGNAWIWVIIVSLVVAAAALLLTIGAFVNKNEIELIVPNLLGKNIEQAEAELSKLTGDYEGFKVIVDVYENNAAPQGTILNQSPREESTVNSPCEIKVIVSSGPAEVVLSNYMGESFVKAEAELTKNDIEVIKKEESSDSFPSGIIIRQEPASGEILAVGAKVTFYVSTGSENVVVPNVVGMSEAEARTQIERNRLSVGEVVHQSNDSYIKGLVYDQSYSAFSKVPEGSKVDIFVSSGPSSQGGGEAEPPKTENQQPSVVDDPSQIEEMKTKYLSLNLPSDRTKVKVKLICDGKVIYEKEHNTASGTADISLKSKGTISVDIYYDNEFVATKEVKFN